MPRNRVALSLAVGAGMLSAAVTVHHHPRAHAPAPAQLAAYVKASPASQAFIAAVAPGAIAAQQKYGVPAAVTIAQAIDESGWGQSSLARPPDNNLFGIKGTGTTGSVTLPTQEFQNGAWVTINAAFRTYGSWAQSIDDHALLLATSGYYARAMADRGNPDRFANDLTGVYATDPTYGAQLIRYMGMYGLYRYGSRQAPPPPSPSSPPPSPAAPPSSAPAAPPSTAPAPPPSPSQSPAPAGSPAPPADSIPRVPGLMTPGSGPAAPAAGAVPAVAPSSSGSGEAIIPGVP